VPRPAAGNTALRTFIGMSALVVGPSSLIFDRQSLGMS
jgi:hypothetical protein